MARACEHRAERIGTTQHVDVHVHHFLVADAARVDDHAKAIGGALFPREPTREHHDLAKRRLVAFTDVVERRDVPLRYKHEMYRRFRIDIVKREDVGVLVHLAARDFAAHDLAEDAGRIAVHGISSNGLERPSRRDPTFLPAARAPTGRWPDPNRAARAARGNETTSQPLRR